MLATAGGEECYLLLCNNRGEQMSCVTTICPAKNSYNKSRSQYSKKHGSCCFPCGEDCSVGGGFFAVQCEAEGHGMVLKLGIKEGER